MDVVLILKTGPSSHPNEPLGRKITITKKTKTKQNWKESEDNFQ